MPKNEPATRERHLGENGEKKRTTLFLDAITRAQLDRLAHRKGYTVTAVIEELAASADRGCCGASHSTWTSWMYGTEQECAVTHRWGA
jgi:hypothetical protein